MKKILALAMAAALGLGALECVSAPKAQCPDGSPRTRTVHHHPVRETCHNGEWVRGR